MAITSPYRLYDRYDVQAFNVAKAREVIKTRPQKLSLQEMYLVAQTYPKGSAEFNNVFDIAVRMFLKISLPISMQPQQPSNVATR